MKTVITLLALLSAAPAFAGPVEDCVQAAGQRLLACRKGCLSVWNEDRMRACEYGCNADYYREKKECGASEAPLFRPALAADESDCQFFKDENGRSVVFCAANGQTYSTWGQCRWYCR